MRFVFKIVHKCSKCKKDYKIADFRSGCKIFKTCIRCRDIVKKSQDKTKCEHNRQKSHCKECGGVSICIHNRLKSHCKECGGVGICIHNRRKDICKDCGGVGICIHNREKSHCKECGGSSICEHKRIKSRCKTCGDPIDITIKNMIKGSRTSDKKYNRYDEPNLVDYTFLKNLIDNTSGCYYCHCELQYTYYTSNLGTIERINNVLGHIKSNCVICCRTCNYARVGENPTI